MASTEEPTVEAAASKKEVGGEQESATAAAAEDEDTGAQVAPIVKLQEVAVTTGEENENVLLNLYALFCINMLAPIFTSFSICLKFLIVLKSF